ncbi:MAG TPA: LamG domain-containing protein [Kofleriaceae bacterium]
MRRWIGLAVLASCGRLDFTAVPVRVDAMTRAPDAGIAGLVAWFPLEDTSGETFQDVIGGVVGTCAGAACPVAAPGHRGQGYRFDGVGNCISIPDVGGHLDLPALTVSIWANQTALGATAECHASKRVDISGNVDNTWELEDYNTGQLAFTSNHGTNSNVQLYTPVETIVPGTWQHLAISWDGATRRVYIDGVPSGSDTQSTPLAYDANAMKIGCDDNVGISEVFDGVLDELQIYDRALSDAELAELAAE